MIGENLLRFKKDQKYISIDGESENLNLLHRNRPWQISMTVYRGTELIESHDDFPWWPDLNVSQGAAVVTHFNYQDYKEKATAPKPILDKMRMYLNDPDYLIVGANLGNFDIYLFNTALREIGEELDYGFMRRVCDIQCIEKAIELQIKIPPVGTDEYLSFLFKMYGFRQRGLKTNVKHLLKKYEVPFDEFRLHDGLYDVGKTKEIFDKQLWKIEI